MQTTSVMLKDLLDDAVRWLHPAGTELPQQVVVGADALANAGDVTFTLSSGSLEVTDLAETPTGEVMLVTAKSADADPVYTVARAYVGTPNVGAVPTGTALLRNPQFFRWDLRRHIVRWFRVHSGQVPLVRTRQVTLTSGAGYIEVPSDVIDVVSVGQLKASTWWARSHAFEFVRDLPSGFPGVSTGQALFLPSALQKQGTTFYVTETIEYTWSTGGTEPLDETDTVPMHRGTEHVPSVYAAAMAVSGRELSRLQVDRSEEWNLEESVRQGVNLRMVRDLWATYYRLLDDARRRLRIPRYRPYTPMRTA